MHVNTNNVVVSSGNNNNNSHVTVKSHAVTHAHIGIMNSRNGQGVVTAQHNQIGLGLAQSESLVTQVRRLFANVLEKIVYHVNNTFFVIN